MIHILHSIGGGILAYILVLGSLVFVPIETLPNGRERYFGKFVQILFPLLPALAVFLLTL